MIKAIQDKLGTVVEVVTPVVLPIVENNLIPDFLLRMAIRQQLGGELARVKLMSSEDVQKKTSAFVKELKELPIAIAQDQANKQHYEVPDEFYQIVLGPFLKYSSGYWPSPKTTLAGAVY